MRRSMASLQAIRQVTQRATPILPTHRVTRPLVTQCHRVAIPCPKAATPSSQATLIHRLQATPTQHRKLACLILTPTRCQNNRYRRQCQRRK